ncbi:MAG: DUF11 domain-containing protein [bacterium]|nr:DUF11 domain-containing protein [bacterium]
MKRRTLGSRGFLFGRVLILIVVVVLVALGASVLAFDQRPVKFQARPRPPAPSTPVTPAPDPDYNGPPIEVASIPEDLAPAETAPPLAPNVATDLVILGLNFQGSQLFVDSGFTPPDTMGAVGPNHVVELINGRFDVYNKATGAEVMTRSLDGFWTTRVGLAIPPFNDICNAGTCSVSGDTCAVTSDCRSNGTFDPRIVYDTATDRWFASALDRTSPATGDNNIYVGRSDTSDPTGDWDGFLFDADMVGGAEFHDYETLAVDADGLYMCTQDFNGPGNESCYSIPKIDLLQPAPNAANMTRFEATPAGLVAVDGAWQPALDFGGSDARAALLGTSGGALLRTDILGAGAAGATLLAAPVAIAGDPGHAAPPAARQPHPFDPTATLENVAPRFVSNVFEQGNSLWAVHSVLGSAANAALRWYEIDESTNTVIQTGLIEDSDEDYHEPSIAVNPFGDVVIGYTCSGPNLAASACISVGETAAAVTTFEPPFVVQVGDGHYWRDRRDPPDNERNRWGDYSATVIDPSDPCTFWTFQEFVAVSAVGDVGPSPKGEDGEWGIQVTEMQFLGCAQVDLEVTKTDNRTEAVPGQDAIDYVITVANTGSSNAWMASVSDTFPASLSCTWTCTPTAGSTCTAGPVGGNISDTVNIRAGGSLTYNANCSLDPFATGILSNTATAAPATGITDIDLLDNSQTDNTTLTPKVDLTVTKTDNVKMAAPGGSLTYDITVANGGPSGVTGAVVADPFPAVLSCTWTCSASGGSSCTAGPLAGDIVDAATIAPLGLLTYTAVCDIDPMAMGWLSNTATAQPPAGVEELFPADNSATDDDTGLSNYFSILYPAILDGLDRYPPEVLKSPVGGTAVDTAASFLGNYPNLVAMDVQPNGDVYFAVEAPAVVNHGLGTIVLLPGVVYLYTDATGGIAPAAQGVGLVVNTLDALDEVNGKIFFSVAVDQIATHAGGAILLFQQNIYEYDAGTITLAFNGGTLGLQTLDALEYLSPTEFGFSTSTPQLLFTTGGLFNLVHQSAYIIDTGTAVVTPAFDGPAVGAATLDALTLAQGLD